MAKELAAIVKQLLTFSREHETAPHAIEKLEADVLLEAGDLPRQRRLRNPQMLRRFGYGA